MLSISISQWATVRPQIHGNNHTQPRGTSCTKTQDKTELHFFLFDFVYERISVTIQNSYGCGLLCFQDRIQVLKKLRNLIFSLNQKQKSQYQSTVKRISISINIKRME